MNDLPVLILVFTGGALLGAVYLAVLWFSVRRMRTHPPAALGIAYVELTAALGQRCCRLVGVVDEQQPRTTVLPLIPAGDGSIHLELTDASERFLHITRAILGADPQKLALVDIGS